MDEGKGGVDMPNENELSSSAAGDAAKLEPGANEPPEERAATLEGEVEAIRDDLGDLVGELDRRRHRAVKPLAIGAIIVAGVCIGGYVLWRALRARPTRAARVRTALERATAHPERVAESKPSVPQKVLVAAASAVAAVVARRAAERWTSTSASVR